MTIEEALKLPENKNKAIFFHSSDLNDFDHVYAISTEEFGDKSNTYVEYNGHYHYEISKDHPILSKFKFKVPADQMKVRPSPMQFIRIGISVLYDYYEDLHIFESENDFLQMRLMI